MITAVDTSVLLDIFAADQDFGLSSKNLVRRCIQEGSLLACEVVWAELVPFFRSTVAAREAMAALEVEFSPLNLDAALLAGSAWKVYRRHGGSRHRVVADFLIGAHATVAADRLLSRDRGFQRRYFSELVILDPAQA